MPQVNLSLPGIFSPAVARTARTGRRLRLSPGLYGWLLPLTLLAGWQLAASQQWISAQVLPSPGDVWLTLSDLATSGDLWLNTRASLQRVLVGFVTGSLLGLALGCAMGLFATLRAFILPGFNGLVQIPVLGWFPFALLIFGIGEPLKYALIAHAALVPVTLGAIQAFRHAPVSLIEVARVNGFSQRQIISGVVLPAAVPVLFSALRLAFTKAWLSLVVVELIASSEGLGYLIVYGRQLFQLDLVMASVVVVGATGWLIDRGCSAAERYLLRHRQVVKGE
ncbi:ABC transporter permease [Shimwellia blattae]|uniref:Putative binding-protein-dependent transport systems inner membrane component n=1 Tax=Shimwellia blattae (strain ATCC 29907 / DSM 4481 / JCM 1650 / NBRC 105725 / CDC 9005-74) TaxID=630626 RepID=I2B653_SHIBC|nr:ABC transporter permease [Shimwellia blattae]AFJ46007.1 putative binding-protein-dependent transport systems inner membrane component [Shimwellia blattae DSM 4481 = NBRC 105725]GAB82714.1 aliphatic sulfonate ABC transporter permease protein [Shimwellia blattae DSM 4481 = NBRC 105725]VDY63483.1 Putative aliphatic sulfonates transport permease protein ssuC [Shimwellia blattae]VEC21423.1 Putative aliphatic sulfonates transport permease protein ssuC [Shimwellia blattae]